MAAAVMLVVALSERGHAKMCATALGSELATTSDWLEHLKSLVAGFVNTRPIRCQSTGTANSTRM
jgi:hypothetical protein